MWKSGASTPRPTVCQQSSVAYSSSAMKAWQDRRDQERFFDFDGPAFFAAMGGTANGAYVRDAMERMRPALSLRPGAPPPRGEGRRGGYAFAHAA